MNNIPIIHLIADRFGKTKLAHFMGVHKSMVTKVYKQKYAPDSWIPNLVDLMQGSYSEKDFLNEITKYKANCIPRVNNKQVQKFLKDVGKNPTSEVNKTTKDVA